MQIDMRYLLPLLIVAIVGSGAEGRVIRSADHLIGPTNYGGSVTFGEQGVSDCIAAGNLPWKCVTEQSGIEPQWW